MDVQFVVGDITSLEVDAIVNPANSEGEMGCGVAGAIKKKGGKKIEQEVMALAPIPLGSAVLTTAGKLKCDFVIHAPTMHVPVQKTSPEKIYDATKASLRVANELNIKKLAIPGMGTGTDRVPIADAATAMTDAIRDFSNTSNGVNEIILVDKNADLIQALEKKWTNEQSREDEGV